MYATIHWSLLPTHQLCLPLWQIFYTVQPAMCEKLKCTQASYAGMQSANYTTMQGAMLLVSPCDLRV